MSEYEESDVNIFVTRDLVANPGEPDYVAQIFRLDDEGDPVGEPIYTSARYRSAGAAIAECEFIWQESG